MLLLDDLRDAARTLRKQPRFLVIASLTLALGIGAVTAIFSVVNAVLFKPLPYPQAERLVNIWSSAPGLGYDQFPLSPDIFLFYERHTTVFEDMALFQNARVNVTESGPPEVLDAAIATHGYFTTLGAGFSRGRAYTVEEDRHDAPRVAVVSHRLWTRRYGADPSLVGRSIRIDGEPSQVVGIAPGWMDRAGSPDVWLPARFNDAEPVTGNFGWSAIGRLKAGVRPEDAASNLTPLVRRAMEEVIQSENYRAFLTDGGYHPRVRPMKEDVVGSVREPLWILLGTVGMVLLIACANVANLSLVRAESRQRELAVRTALGSSRSDLIRKLLTESLLVSLAGTVLGVPSRGPPCQCCCGLRLTPSRASTRSAWTASCWRSPPASPCCRRSSSASSRRSATRARVSWRRCGTAGGAPRITPAGSAAGRRS
jgi:predicted permease